MARSVTAFWVPHFASRHEATSVAAEHGSAPGSAASPSAGGRPGSALWHSVKHYLGRHVYIYYKVRTFFFQQGNCGFEKCISYFVCTVTHAMSCSWLARSVRGSSSPHSVSRHDAKAVAVSHGSATGSATPPPPPPPSGFGIAALGHFCAQAGGSGRAHA